MRYAFLTAGLALCCLLASPMSAQQDHFTTYGPVAASCGSYSAASLTLRENYDLWVLGFVSGTNRERASGAGPILARTDVQGIKTWVAKYCAEHPLDDVAAAAIALVIELTKRAEVK